MALAFGVLVAACAALAGKGGRSSSHFESEPAPERTREFWDPNDPGAPAERIRIEHLDDYAEWKERTGR